MKTKFFFFLAMLLMSSVGVFAQSETNTPLKGDLNEDGKVDAADVVVLVDIIMKKNVDPNKYYWYIGVDNPSSISNIQTDITVPGWHEIGSSLSGFEIEFNPGTQELHLSDERVIYNVIIPEGLNIYDSFGDNGEYMFTKLTCNIPGYKAYRYIPDEDFPAGTRDVTGVIIKSNDNIDSNKYYWYIGVDNPSSISNLQTDNTVGGWHEIGSSLSGFTLDTNTNSIHISEERVQYYVIIPNNLHIYNGLNMNIENVTFEAVTCNISGYKAFKYLPSGGSTGVRDVTGIIIKSDNIDSNKYYWYIGVDNPSSISNLQTDNTKPGWHEIGTSLSGFVLNTDANSIQLSSDSRVIYNVIIPNDLHIYAADGTTNVETTYFNSTTCNINGYKAFRDIPSEYYPDGEWEVTGIILKQ